MRNVKIILAKGAEAPIAHSAGAAGLDLVACIKERVVLHPQAPAQLIPTGVRLDMSAHPDMCAVIVPRSGLGHKKGLVMGNGVGLIDSDYQGELFVSAWNRNPSFQREGLGQVRSPAIVIEPGERIAQLVFLPVFTPQLVFERVEAFEETDRGEGGFGSTGAK